MERTIEYKVTSLMFVREKNMGSGNFILIAVDEG